MSGKPPKKGFVVLLLVTLFGVGLVWLFWLRFQAGDLYPPYSSLRSDPLGIQVFFESVNRVDGARGAERSFRPLDQVALAPDTTLLVCGVRDGAPFLQDRSWIRLLERLSAQGGRLVIAFRATRRQSNANIGGTGREPDDLLETPPAEKKEEEKAEKPDEAAPEAFDLLKRLGISVETVSAEEYDDFALLGSDWPQALPEMIPWRSRIAFDLQAPEWEVVYWWQEAPVVVQRAWGQGTVVLAGDSYLLSNEALRSDRVTELLAWWVDLPNRLLIVDEFHHGLVKQPGIANLVRKYRLQGVAASLLILVVLLLWRQAAPFAPVPPEVAAAAEESAVGQAAEEGWVGLMQQHIRSEELLRVCHAAWRASPAVNRVPDERVAQLADLMAATAAEPRRRNPVTLYREICQLLKEGKHS